MYVRIHEKKSKQKQMNVYTATAYTYIYTLTKLNICCKQVSYVCIRTESADNFK